MIDEDGTVVHEIALAAPPEDVFAMFVRSELLTRWIGLSAELQPRPGGAFRFEIVPGSYCEGRYVEVDPPTRLVLTWGWTDPSVGVPPGSSRVEVTIRATPSGSLLRLVHDRLPGDLRRLHDDGWTRFLRRLSAVLAGADPGEYPAGDPGVDAGPDREFAGGGG